MMRWPTRLAAATASVIATVTAVTLIASAQAQSGYALDQPQIYAAQRVWGIAHGARLLALACAQAGHGAAAESWVTWREREAPTVLATSQTLGRHYFDDPAAPPAAVSAALGLKPALDLSPEQLAPACATLADALQQARYDLARRHAEFLNTPNRP